MIAVRSYLLGALVCLTSALPLRGVEEPQIEKLNDQAELARIAKTADNWKVRQAAFERSLSLRPCRTSAAGLAAWPRAEKVSISPQLFFAQDLPAEEEGRIRRIVLDVSSSALRALGFNVVASDTGEPVVEIEAFGAAEGRDYSRVGFSYTGARWNGAMSIHRNGCLYGRAIKAAISPPSAVSVFSEHPTARSVSHAPFDDAMRQMLVAAMVRLATDLGGEKDLNRLANASDFALGAAAANKLATLAESAKTMPKLETAPRPGSFSYAVKGVQGNRSTEVGSWATVLKEEEGSWTATDTMGAATLTWNLDKKTLAVLRFLMAQGPNKIDLEFLDDEATGTIALPDRRGQVSVSLAGPVFAESGAGALWMTCLPLAEGYSVTFPAFGLDRQETTRMRLTVAGTEVVTVPAGTFNSFKVDISSAKDGRGASTIWIAKDSRKVVKTMTSSAIAGGLTMVHELR
jgi:hypothetical protein